MTEDQTDPTLGPDGTDAVDLNPERCSFTWTPGADTLLGRMGFDTARCTSRIDEVNHGHRWDSREQDDWIRATHANIAAVLEPNLLQTRGGIALTNPATEVEPLRAVQLTEADDRILEAFDRSIGIRRGLRAVAAIGWDEGHAATDEHGPGNCICANPYRDARS